MSKIARSIEEARELVNSMLKFNIIMNNNNNNNNNKFDF